MMRKRTLLAVLMAAILLLTASCSLVVKNEEVDKQTVIVSVLDKTLVKGDFMTQYDAQASAQASYGYDMTSQTNISALQDSIINSFVQNTVLNSKLTENGFDTLDEAAMTQAKEAAKTDYDYYYDLVKSMYFGSTELTGDELDQAVIAQMGALGLGTLEQTEENAILSQKYTLLQDKFTADVTVTDEEVQTEYDSRVAAAKESYATTLTQYSTDVNNGSTIYYRPAGYRYVKNLLVQLSEADSTAIADLNSQITTKTSERTSAESTIADYEDDTEEAIAALDDDAKASREATYAAAKTSKETLDKELDELNTQLAAKTKEAYAAIMPTIEEIKTKLAAGESFDALLETYGQDEGMKVSPAKETGYLVCAGLTRYVTAFTDASMALEKVGDVSDAVETSYGYHLIQYASDVQEGAVALDEVKTTIHDELLSTKKTTAFNAIVEQWVTEANAKIDKNALK